MQTNWGRRSAAGGFLAVILAIIFLCSGGEESIGRRMAGWFNGFAQRHFGTRHALSSDSGRNNSNSHRMRNGTPIPGVKGADSSLSCTIAGKVANEEGKPLKDARITVREVAGTYNRAVQTDANGHYELATIPEGTFDVLAAHPSYVTLIRPNFTMTARKKITADFKLPLGAVLKGLVTDEGGKALNGVRISAHRSKMEQMAGGATWVDDSTYKTQLTDQGGTFTLAGVSLGKNVFEIAKAGYEIENRSLDVRPDKSEELKIILRKTGKLAGIVMDEDKNPVAGATVKLTRYKPFGASEEKLDPAAFVATSDTSGTFTFTKLYTEGFYDLLVENENFAPTNMPLVSVGNDKVACVLERGGQIDGLAMFIDRPTTEASVLLVAEAVIKGTTVTKSVKSDGGGHFKMDHLPYGTYKLMVDSSDFVGEPASAACTKEKSAKNVIVQVYEAAVARGRVSDGENDAPVAGATITIAATYGPKQSKTKTFTLASDSHGEFQFRLPAGLHVAQANAKGYLRTLNDRSQQKFTLTPGEKKSDLALRLNHGGSVEGFVLDPNGRSIESAEVQLFTPTEFNGHVDTKPFNCTTDPSGYFKIWGIDVGERLQLYASVAKTGFAKTRSQLVTLTARKPDGSTQVTMQPGGVILGKVTDKKDLPVPGAELKFVSMQFPGDPTKSEVKTYSGPDGSFELPLCTAGSGTIAASRSGFVEQSRYVVVNAVRPQRDVNFMLDAGLKIQGRIASLEGKPIPNAKVFARGIQGAQGRDDAVTDKDGRYELTNLGKGAFRVETTFKVKTSDGDQNYKFINPKVSAGSAAGDIDCDLSNGASGIVEDDNHKGVNRFTVYLHSKTDTQTPQDFVFNIDRPYSSARGSYRFLNTPRGIYSMRVVAEGFEPYQNENLTIGPHARTNIPSIRLKPAGGVIGTIVSTSTGRPVSGATVRLIDTTKSETDARANAPAATSDYTGSFRVGSVKPGNYNIEYTHPTYIASKVNGIWVTQKKETDVGRVELEAGGAVQGTVVDDTGAPVTGLSVSVSGLSPRKEVYTDAAGNYLLQGVEPGRWPIVAKGNLNSRKVYAFSTVAVQADESETADFHLETAADLDGMLTASDGIVRSGAVHIHPYDEYANVLEDVHYDTTAHSAAFQLKGVPTGQYFLWASGFGAVSSYTAWQTLFLSRGANNFPINIGIGSVRGATIDPLGAGVSGVNLQLLPKLDSLRVPQALYNLLVRPGVSGSNGQYQYGYLQPGAYQLLYSDPNAAGTWFALSPFTVGTGQNAEYNIQLSAK